MSEAADSKEVSVPPFVPASTVTGGLLRASIYDGRHELLSDVKVDLVDRNARGGGTWAGTFKLNNPRQYIKKEASYTLKFEDGRSGTIFIVDFDDSSIPIDPWVSFRGSGALI